MTKMENKTNTQSFFSDIEKESEPDKIFPVFNYNNFKGLLKEIVDTATKNCEASAIGIAVTFITYISAYIGRSCYIAIGDGEIHCRPFIALTGKSGKGRKGESEKFVKTIFKKINKLHPTKSLYVASENIGSGEGIIDRVKDSDGESDKRLLIVQHEFVNILTNAARPNSNISGVLRTCFDGDDLGSMVKGSPSKATDPHIVILGHITTHELREKMADSGEIYNGFMNRFLLFCTKREREIAWPEPTDPEKINYFVNRIDQIISFIDREANSQKAGSNRLRYFPNAEAKVYYEQIYSKVSESKTGFIGSLMGRYEQYILMLSMIFAILDKSLVIKKEHLELSEKWLAYAEEAMVYIFDAEEDRNEQNEMKDLSKKILDKLEESKMPITKTQLHGALSNNVTAKGITQSLDYLLTTVPPCIKTIQMKTEGAKRLTTFYSLNEIG